MGTVVLFANLLVNLWLLTIVHRQNVRKQLPWFASYIAWAFVSGLFELAFWLLGRESYGTLYWTMEAVEITLIVGAVRESFLRRFRGFTAIGSFRWLVWAAICVVVAYSGWKALHARPLYASRLDAFIADAESLFRWGIAGIAVLTAALALWLEEHLDTREDAVVIGFGVVSLSFLLYVGSFSVFPKQYIFLFRYLPSVGYFVAAFWWIWIFSRPVPERRLKDLKLGREIR